jgi:hypothetical protein
MVRACEQIIAALEESAERRSTTTASIADHDRSHAGAVSAITVAIAVTVAVAVTIPIPIPITVPEHAPIAIVIVALEEAARAADAEVVANLATHARDRLGDAELVLRQTNIGRAGEADRSGAVGQQRRAEDGRGAQCGKQQLVHCRTSSFFSVRIGKPPNRIFSKSGNAPGPNRERITAVDKRQQLKERARRPAADILSVGRRLDAA